MEVFSPHVCGIPDEIWLKVMSILTENGAKPENLGNVRLVSKKMNLVALDSSLWRNLQKLRPLQNFSPEDFTHLMDRCTMLRNIRLDWEGNETSKEDSNPRTANWFGRSRIGRILNNSSISRLFRSRSQSAGATSEGSPELTEYIENLEKAIYAIKSRGIGTEHIRIGFTSPLSICNDVMKNVIFHTLEEYESTIRSFEFGDRDDTRQYGNHHFCCQLNQRHLELIPTFLSQLTSLDILVHPVDSDDIEDFIEMETLADSCHNIRRLRIESWKNFSPKSIARLLLKLHDHLEWLELIWVQPGYRKSGSAWAIVYETLQELARWRFPPGISVLEHYRIYRAWEKNGCVFIKEGSETKRRGEWRHVVRDFALSLEMLRCPFETRCGPWTWRTPVMEE